jgi:CBS domain-containing protein
MRAATKPVREAATKPAVKAEPKPEAKRVRDVMTADPDCVTTGDSLRDVAKLLDENEISGAPVVDDQDRLVGVISRTDLLHRLLEGPVGSRADEDWLDLLTADSARSVDVDAIRLGVVDDLMSVDPVTAKADEAVATVAHRLAEKHVHRAIVVDARKRPVGIVTTLDLLRVFPG